MISPRKAAIALCFLFSVLLNAQQEMVVNATLDPIEKTISIQQTITYANTSNDTLKVVYFNDWANAYSSKNSALAKRFAEDFKRGLHLAKEKERGRTEIISIVDNNYTGVRWNRTNDVDILKVTLNKPLLPMESRTLVFTYVVHLPPNKYTVYGYGADGSYYLKDWYLTPAVYMDTWRLYANKNLEDLYSPLFNCVINFSGPKGVFYTSNFHLKNSATTTNGEFHTYTGTKRKSAEIIINRIAPFEIHKTEDYTFYTDIQLANFTEIQKGMSIQRISDFISEHLGSFPHEKIIVSTLDYDKSPIYGLSQLPKFIRPYEADFHFEITFLKTALRSFIKETVHTDSRKEQWLTDGFVNYLLFKYVKEKYPNQKLIGKLADIWGIRKFHAAEMAFNDQYATLYMLTARKNLAQALSTSNDSLIKFNQKIANKYKAGLGFAYLGDYIGFDVVDSAIKQFVQQNIGKATYANRFEALIKKASPKPIDWFFDQYVAKNARIDFKISAFEKKVDSIKVTIRNKTGTNVPISLFALKNDSVAAKYWLEGITSQREITIPNNALDKLVLNYEKMIPEFNQRDNWKSLKGFLASNKKLSFQFFKDLEDPFRNQVFYSPILGFNFYDGAVVGARLHNKTILERPFVFDFSPSYATKEKSMVGYGRLNYRKYYQNRSLYVANYSLSASSFHFQTNSRYSIFTPSVTLAWRPDDLLSNKKDLLTLRYVNVIRDTDENLDLTTEPDYGVLNARFTHSNNNILSFNSWNTDVQHAADFSKIAFTYEYRHLSDSNQQFNFRFFAGKFLRNNRTTNYFDFALDRPTDYLFDYNYLGRSEDSGIYSQQLIIAEGGFKSKLSQPFADDWMVTANMSLNLWRWVEYYSDFGFTRNKGQNPEMVYDMGIRLNLVTDYFELYFPLYSNNGWETSLPNYDERIRFIVTISPRTLTGLFTRKWF